RHLLVGEQHADRLARHHRQRLFAARRRVQREHAFELHPEQLEVVDLIVDEQHRQPTRGHRAPPSPARGSDTTNRAPPPSSASTPMVPPWRIPISRATASPSPVPPVSRRVVKNGSKIFA